jgi:DNA-binding HxlR family transcriptional regulator
MSFLVAGNNRNAGTPAEDGIFLCYRYLMDTDLDPACRWNVLSAACPTRQVLGRVADKWTMLVITALSEQEVLRFSELRRRVDGVTQKVLTQTLRGLERDGLVERTVFPTVPVTVQYRLTALGHSLGAAVNVIKAWTYENIEELERARSRYDEAAAAALAVRA